MFTHQVFEPTIRIGFVLDGLKLSRVTMLDFSLQMSVYFGIVIWLFATGLDLPTLFL